MNKEPEWDSDFQEIFDRAFPGELKGESASILKNGRWQEFSVDDWRIKSGDLLHEDDDACTELSDDEMEQQERLERALSEKRVALAYQRARLTKREREVFTLRARGYTQEEVGRKLRITQQAVSKSFASALEKLQKLKSCK